MRCIVRVLIHDEKYQLLHERMEKASFSRTGVDSATGKSIHLDTGLYFTEAYSDTQAVLLVATAAALSVDPRPEIVVFGGERLLTYGCREVQKDGVAGFIDLLSKSTVPVPAGGLYDFYQHQEKGSALGVIPVGNPDHSSMWDALLKAK
ncbi:MAG: hypothetical protein WA634_02930 [Silvibacterium sp.]